MIREKVLELSLKCSSRANLRVRRVTSTSAWTSSRRSRKIPCSAKFALAFITSPSLLATAYTSFARAASTSTSRKCKYSEYYIKSHLKPDSYFFAAFSKKNCPMCRQFIMSHRNLRDDHKTKKIGESKYPSPTST